MSLLWTMLIYLLVGFAEWYIALRRTLACARGEVTLLVLLVFLENVLALWVLSSFIKDNDWAIALVYSSGSAMGALVVSVKKETKIKSKIKNIMKTIKQCFFQIFRPKKKIIIPDMGDCTTCQPDEKNLLCKQYQPTDIEVEIKDK